MSRASHAAAVLLCGVGLSAEPLQRKPAAPPRPMLTTSATCVSDLGMGVTSRRRYCDVMVAKTGAASVEMVIPTHVGAATLMFDLHNRFNVPPAGTAVGDAFQRAVALVAVVRPMGQLIDRAAVRREFRTIQDLFDRLGGGPPAAPVKAVAPGFPEPIRITIPAGVASIGIVGVRLEASTLAVPRGVADAPGRPIAMVSNLRIEYTPVR
jgi:hypothetical protein